MSGGRNGDFEVADGAGIVRGDGMGHVSRQGGCMQQPVQDVAFAMRT